MRTTVTSNTRCSYPGFVIRPRTVRPTSNGPSSFTPNHVPNSRESVRARQTRALGARSRMSFRIESGAVMCNLLVACDDIVAGGKAQPGGCVPTLHDLRDLRGERDPAILTNVRGRLVSASGEIEIGD